VLIFASGLIFAAKSRKKAMKIVNRDQLLGMPDGTVYSRYENGPFVGLFVKTKTVGSDFLVQELVGNVMRQDNENIYDILTDMERGKSHLLDFDLVDRERRSDIGQMYAIYEPVDLNGLISTLELCE
jgi:hypothetical protein